MRVGVRAWGKGGSQLRSRGRVVDIVRGDGGEEEGRGDLPRTQKAS